MSGIRRLVLVSMLTLFAISALSPRPAHADPLPAYGAGVQYSNAYVVLEVNGAPILTFGVAGEETGYSGGGGGSIATWLMPGKNEIAVVIEKRGTGEPNVVLEIRDPKTGETEVTAEFDKVGRHVVHLESTQLPEWSFLSGEKWSGDEKGLTAAVTALHTAASKKDIDALMTVHAPFVADNATLWDLDPIEMRKELAGAFAAALTIDPLPKLTIKPYFDGRVLHVTGPKGEAPIGGNGAEEMRLEMGEWWSKLRGEWKVVR